VGSGPPIKKITGSFFDAALEIEAKLREWNGATPLRVGVVGADPRGFGARAHIPAVKQSPLLELSAICTRHDETAEEAAKTHGVPHWYSSIDDMIADGQVDLVTIAVRPANHYALAKAVIGARLPVYCEWPLALDTRQAEGMADAARAEGVPTAVGLQGRFSPTFGRLRSSIETGAIGRPLSFSASLVQAAFRVDSDRSWLTEASEASGALFVATAHLIDVMELMLGRLESVVAMTRTAIEEGTYEDDRGAFRWATEDTVQLLAKLDNGVTGVINVTNTATQSSGFELQVLGDQGQVDARAPEYLQFSPVTAQVTDRSGGIVMDKPQDVSAEWSPATNVERALTAFGRSLIDGDRFTPNFDDGLRLHRIVDAVRESSADARWLSDAGW
jgi:predicted dehydrogenase